mgnify:CR=1 FL=1
MPLFDQLVDEALKSQGEMAPLRPVVEKELLHHDILRELGQAGLLRALTFIGGTCLLRFPAIERRPRFHRWY